MNDMPADAVRRATLTLRPAEGVANSREVCFTSLSMRRTYDGDYGRPASSSAIDLNKVPGFWDAFHKIVAQHHADERILDGAIWEATWVDGDSQGRVGGMLGLNTPVGPDESDRRYEELVALFEGLCR